MFLLGANQKDDFQRRVANSSLHPLLKEYLINDTENYIKHYSK